MLQFKGYRTSVARNGREALEIARQEPPDLVLLDVMMPEVDGLAVCRIFKQDPRLKDVRILMLTAKSGREDVVVALEAGASDYVTKPFFFDELDARIRTNLEVKRYHDDLAAMLRISQAVSSSLDSDEVLFTIVSELGAVVKSDRVSLIKVIDDRTGYLVATREEPEMRNQELSLEEYPEILKAASERRVVVIDDTDNDPLLADVTERIPGRKSVLIVPLDVHKQLGEYVLLSSREHRPYTRPEIRTTSRACTTTVTSISGSKMSSSAPSGTTPIWG